MAYPCGFCKKKRTLKESFQSPWLLFCQPICDSLLDTVGGILSIGALDG